MKAGTKIWFMFDNHLFRSIDPMKDMFPQIRKCFDEDGCGSIFVRDEKDKSLRKLDMHADWKKHGNKFIVTDDEIREWIKLFEKETLYHYEDCWQDGPLHYDCAMKYVAFLQDKLWPKPKAKRKKAA